MTTTEKIAGTYLRLNGFLLLPHFTVFDGARHGHVDFCGMRAANSEERVKGSVLGRDDDFFKLASTLLEVDALTTSFGVVVEVKTNANQVMPWKKRVDYVRPFLGNSRLLSLSFAKNKNGLTPEKDGIEISVGHALKWIFWRIDSMNGMGLTKPGSWTWSEEFLADLLVLRRLGISFRE